MLELMLFLLQSNGLIFAVVMMLATLALLALVLALMVGLRPGRAVNAGVLRRLTEAAGSGPAALAEQARGESSYLGQTVSAGVSRLPHGLEEARYAIARSIERLQAPWERVLRWLGTLGLMCPFLGLLGTVLGVILASMAIPPGANLQDAAFIKGVGHALSVTLEGLFLAVLALPAHVLFKNRLHRLMLAASGAADDLVTQAHERERRAA
jgi:biopolymer transport protein ExbB